MRKLRLNPTVAGRNLRGHWNPHPDAGKPLSSQIDRTECRSRGCLTQDTQRQPDQKENVRKYPRTDTNQKISMKFDKQD